MPPPRDPAAAGPALNLPALDTPQSPPAFSADERHALLIVARAAIVARLEGEKFSPAAPSFPRLCERCGAFTTLRLGSALRGCVGYVTALLPLYRTVAEAAVGAAFQDFRFAPLTREEFHHTRIEISVLSPLRSARVGDIVIGRDGLVVSLGACRGLLLPQVAVEHRWDAATFLSQTCLKAGLPPDAWLRDAHIEAFSAEVFGEET